MKFALILVSMAFGPIIQAATTPITQLKCSPGFFLCVVKDSWCNGWEAIAICRRAGNGFDLVACCPGACRNIDGLPRCL
ncbi:hypothetical protein VE03_04434 [Pseudogymnoascus sp. 23342-1-I1]|nr:hypothetical protein VE03_04434 [Pseudogymnoascus sp. 23342-1-I1]